MVSIAFMLRRYVPSICCLSGLPKCASMDGIVWLAVQYDCDSGSAIWQ
jgi:hypothetical protein